MVEIPLRKCYRLARVALVLIIVVGILASFERWRGKRRTAGAALLDDELSYEQQIREDEARIIPGLGEGGAVVYLSDRDKELGEESLKKLAINVYLSDQIAYNRSLKDHRNPACKRVTYDAELPSASVILIFHNEPYSVVVRTIWSVLESARRDRPWHRDAKYIDRETGKAMTLGYPGQDPNSKYVYLKEIILVDDNSTLPELKGKLSYYIRTRMPPDMIRILRLPERVGLTRARLAGARYSAGDVLIFLDSHCEVQPDWLRPILQRVKQSPHTVAVPIIDVIDARTMYYSVLDSTTFQIGGFNFNGHFTWIDVPEREKLRRGSDIAPTWSPTMAGGLFAINREYFWEIGAYDEQMAGWGGENLEMSFRLWQCGGTLETIPCSRVGHVFRSFHPYALPATTDTHGINTARMAEVWMDDYKELFYLNRPDLRKSPKIGDITHRKVLREKLQCKGFEWYLRHIYKEKFVPVRDTLAYGRFANPESGLCLDTLQRDGEGAPLGLYPCHPTLQGPQYLSLDLQGLLRDEERCAQLHYTRDKEDDKLGRKLLMADCSKKQNGQKWRYTPSKQLIHSASSLCLESGYEAGADVLAKPCAPGAPTQKWEIDYNEYNGFKRKGEEPTEVELALQKLRGQRRTSRSLLAQSEENNANGSNNSARRRNKKKRKHKKTKHIRKRSKSKGKSKNKFILKLVRALGNGSEDHLEAEIRCKHRQLYSNNTFVRDLVTALNDNNIKVINNGRVFERNHVAELPRAPRTHNKKAAKAAKGLDKGAVDVLLPKQAHSTTKQYERAHTIPPAAVTKRWPHTKKKHHRDGYNDLNANEQMQDKEAKFNKAIVIEEFVDLKHATEPPPPPPPPSYQPITNRPEKVLKKKKKKKKHGKKSDTPQKEVWLPDRRNMVSGHEDHKHKEIDNNVGASTPPAPPVLLYDTRPRPTADYTEPANTNTNTNSTAVATAVGHRAATNVWDKDGGSTERDTSESNDRSEQEDRPTRRQKGDKDTLGIETLPPVDTSVTKSPGRRQDVDSWQRWGRIQDPLQAPIESNRTFSIEEFANKWRSEPVQAILQELPHPANGNASVRGKPAPTRRAKEPETAPDQPSHESLSRESEPEDYSDTSSESAELEGSQR